jgi:hypothetical protein
MRRREFITALGGMAVSPLFRPLRVHAQWSDHSGRVGGRDVLDVLEVSAPDVVLNVGRGL